MSRRVDNGFRPEPWQLYFLRKKAKVKLALCGLGSGKTALGANWALLLMTDKRATDHSGVSHPNFGWVVGQDFPTVLNTSWREFKKFLPDGIYQANEGLHRIRVMESECQFISADDPDSLRGGNVNWVLVDEPAMIRNEEAWLNIVGRARRGISCVVALTGTPKGFNWLYEKVWQRAGKCDLLAGNEEPVVRRLTLEEIVARDEEPRDGYWAIRIPSWLSGRVSQDDIDQAQRDLSPDWFMQEYGADFRSYTGLVYPEFRKEAHVVEEGPLCSEWWGTIDWGYHEPAAALLCGRSEENELWVEDEFYASRVEPDHQIAWCLERQHRNAVIAWIADASRADLIARARKAGLRVWPADNAPGTIAPGLEEVRRRLRSRQLLISPKCRNLIKEFSLYRYPERASSVSERPLDRDNHALDALRNLAWKLREVPAKQAQKEDRRELPWWWRDPEPVGVNSYWHW